MQLAKSQYKNSYKKTKGCGINSGNLKTYGGLDVQLGGLSRRCSLVHRTFHKVCSLLHINRLPALAQYSVHSQKWQLRGCAGSLHDSAGSAHPASLAVALYSCTMCRTVPWLTFSICLRAHREVLLLVSPTQWSSGCCFVLFIFLFGKVGYQAAI